MSYEQEIDMEKIKNTIEKINKKLTFVQYKDFALIDEIADEENLNSMENLFLKDMLKSAIKLPKNP